MKDLEKTINELIDKSKIAYIGSVDAKGFPNMKAMLFPRKRDSIQVFYFSTNTSSLRVKQYLENPKACIYFCKPEHFRGVMLRGIMEVLTDAKYKQMLWCKGDEIYYSKGVTDPDYCVLRFTASSGRIYENFQSESFEVPINR